MYISFLVLSLLNFLPYGIHFFPINLTVQEESQFPSVKGQQLRYPIYFDTRTPMTEYREHHPLFKDQPIPQFKQDRVVIYNNFLTVEGVYHLQIPHFITEVRSSRIAGFINFNNPDLRKDVSQNINYGEKMESRSPRLDFHNTPLNEEEKNLSLQEMCAMITVVVDGGYNVRERIEIKHNTPIYLMSQDIRGAAADTEQEEWSVFSICFMHSGELYVINISNPTPDIEQKILDSLVIYQNLSAGEILFSKLKKWMQVYFFNLLAKF